MSRLSIQKIDGEPQFTPASKKGKGTTGQIRTATIFGSEIKITLVGRKERLNRGSFIDYLNAEAQKIDSLKDRKLEKGWFFGFGGCTDKDIKDLFNDILKDLPNQTSPLGAQLIDSKKRLDDAKAFAAQRKADFATDAKIMNERFYFPINSELDNCRVFKSKLPQYIKNPKPSKQSFLLHNECLRDRYPEDKEYIVFRDELQTKLLEKMEIFSNLHSSFTENSQRDELISELSQFYPSREEALAIVEKKMSPEAVTYLEEGWPVEETPTKEKWLANVDKLLNAHNKRSSS